MLKVGKKRKRKERKKERERERKKEKKERERERKKEREKAHKLDCLDLCSRACLPAVSFACLKLHHVAKETKFKIGSISEYMSRSNTRPVLKRNTFHVISLIWVKK